jgi:hypothetical protein
MEPRIRRKREEPDNRPVVVIDPLNPRVYSRDRGVMTPSMGEYSVVSAWIVVPLFIGVIVLDALTNISPGWIIASGVPVGVIGASLGVWIVWRRWKRDNPILPDVCGDDDA